MGLLQDVIREGRQIASNTLETRLPLYLVLHEFYYVEHQEQVLKIGAYRCSLYEPEVTTYHGRSLLDLGEASVLANRTLDSCAMDMHSIHCPFIRWQCTIRFMLVVVHMDGLILPFDLRRFVHVCYGLRGGTSTYPRATCDAQRCTVAPGWCRAPSSALRHTHILTLLPFRFFACHRRLFLVAQRTVGGAGMATPDPTGPAWRDVTGSDGSRCGGENVDSTVELVAVRAVDVGANRHQWLTARRASWRTIAKIHLTTGPSNTGTSTDTSHLDTFP